MQRCVLDAERGLTFSSVCSLGLWLECNPFGIIVESDVSSSAWQWLDSERVLSDNLNRFSGLACELVRFVWGENTTKNWMEFIAGELTSWRRLLHAATHWNPPNSIISKESIFESSLHLLNHPSPGRMTKCRRTFWMNWTRSFNLLPSCTSSECVRCERHIERRIALAIRPQKMVSLR